MGAPTYALLMQWENLRSLGFASISATYTGIGTSLANPARLIALYNSTDQDLFLSTDGINDKIVIPSRSQRIYDIASNKSTQAGCLFLAAGQRLYVRYPGSAPTLGSIFFEVAFGSDTGQG